MNTNIEDQNNKIEFKKFSSIDEIPEFLDIIKKQYLDLHLNLNRHEMSKFLTNTLNISLLGNITKLEEAYDYFIASYDDISKKVPIIIEKIRQFNKNNNYEYYVDPEKVFYISFYNEIQYVKNIIQNHINNSLLYNLDMVLINSYLINKLYNEKHISKNYVFILCKIIETNNENIINNENLKQFLTINKINKIHQIINILHDNDTEFIKLLDDIKKDKFLKESDNNTEEKKDNFTDIEVIEQDFNQQKNKLLNSKRSIDIDKLLSDENLNNIINNPIIPDDIWYAFNYFIYKIFSFDYDLFKNKLVTYLQNNKTVKYVELDEFKDINTPFMVFNSEESTNLKGGSNKYFAKYLKYKQKYLLLKGK